MPQYAEGDIVWVADQDEERDAGIVAVLSAIFGGEALVDLEGQPDKKMIVPLGRLSPFYRTSMNLAH